MSPPKKGELSDEKTPLVASPKNLVNGLTDIVRAGAGTFADGYDLFVIDVIVAILAEMYPDQMQPHHKSFAVGMTYAGIMLGQLGFGCALDFFSHKLISIATAVVSMIGCATAACCMPDARFAIGYQLGICRLVLGIGVGGEYPVSAAFCVNRSEGYFSHAKRLAAVASCFVFGMLLAPTLLLILEAARVPLEVVWRVGFACGILPSLVAFVLRLQIHRAPTPIPTTSGLEPTAVNKKGFAQTLLSNWWPLFGCCLQWLLHNMIFFGLGSFKSILNENMFGAKSTRTSTAKIRSDSLFALYAGICTLISSLGTFAIIDRIAHHHLICAAFFSTSVLLVLCGVFLGPCPTSGWVLQLLYFGYCITVQPGGVMSYCIAALSFPPEVRSTCLGVASASAKGGALIGAALFPIVEHAFGLVWPLFGAGIVASVAGVVAFTIAPRNNHQVTTTKLHI